MPSAPYGGEAYNQEKRESVCVFGMAGSQVAASCPICVLVWNQLCAVIKQAIEQSSDTEGDTAGASQWLSK